MSVERAEASIGGGKAHEFGTPARVIAALARIVELALDQGDLTLAQYRLLGYLAGRPSIPTHLARWLGVRKQSMTRQLDVLVSRGYLGRTTPSEDRRQVLYTVTKDGIDALHRTEDRLALFVDGLLGHLGERDRASVRRGLDLAGVALATAWDRTQRGDFTPPN